MPVVLLGNAKLRPHSLDGLREKLFLAVELLWLFVVAWTILRSRQVCQTAAAPAA